MAKRCPQTVAERIAAIVVLVLLTACAHGAPLKGPATKFGALEAAVRHLRRTFAARYPKGEEFLRRLAAARGSGDGAGFAALQREALPANPLVRGRPILFVTRAQFVNEYLCRSGR